MQLTALVIRDHWHTVSEACYKDSLLAAWSSRWPARAIASGFSSASNTTSQAMSLTQESDLQWDALYQADAIDRRNYLGPLIIGSILELALFGILMMQIRTYSRRACHDNRLLRLTAWASFLCALTLTVAVFVDARYRCIVGSTLLIQDAANVSSKIATLMLALGASSFRLPLVSNRVVSVRAEFAMAMAVFVVEVHAQMFFAWRIRELTRKRTRWVAVLVACLGTMAFGACIAANVHAWALRPPQFPNDAQASRDYDFIHSPSPYSTWIKYSSTAIWMGANVACNLTITATLAQALYPALRDAAIGEKRPKIGTLLRLTFETGIVNTVFAIVMTGLLFSEAPATQYLRYIFYYPSGVLYSSWLLASLSACSSKRSKPSPSVNITGTKSTHLGELRFQTNAQPLDGLTVTILSTVDEDRGSEEQSSVEEGDETLAPPPSR
ncbi:hypothetical protein CCMSSC00406_0009636 [Pleurotus cornucopiae]|uniref:Uncharacterized protein n=1 Tax=Pleurotus cornucopiae TaxID=5321 RepID=A0ACB7JAJ2_PLECO|nr:hypothetical protein CCMSSC00406_0009636 [Pleurotus cornucopiae]